MPIHDWTRVDAGVFHDFHNTWITHIKEALNAGVLPPDYYALTDQVIDLVRPDVVTLQTPGGGSGGTGGTALADAPPRTRTTAVAAPLNVRRRPRRVVVRHVTGHRVVAVIEVVSPANKDRRRHVVDCAGKIAGTIAAGIHVLLIDLFPPTPSAPGGLHREVWRSFVRERYTPPADEPLMLASYRVARPAPVAYLEPTAVGRPVPPMPLFLEPTRYMTVPLDPTYTAAFAGTPAVFRATLEA